MAPLVQNLVGGKSLSKSDSGLIFLKKSGDHLARRGGGVIIARQLRK